MAWLRSEEGYDRSRILKNARKASRKGRHGAAIREYAKVLAKEPDNVDLLRKVATHRARAKQREEALRDFTRAAGLLSKRGFVEQAIGVYREAANYLGNEVRVWEGLCQLELARARRVDAVEVLLDGSRRFRRRSRRAQGIALLSQARRIDPTHFGANFALARLCARSGERSRARRILYDLTRAVKGRNLRRVRAQLFWLGPTPAAAWRWMVAAPA